MSTIRALNWLLAAAVVVVAPSGSRVAEAVDPPKGFQFIQDWGVYASDKGVFWHAGVQWRLKDGTWVRLSAGNWVPEPAPPPAIAAIPKDQASCPPGLAKKGCVPPGQAKKRGAGSPPGPGGDALGHGRGKKN